MAFTTTAFANDDRSRVKTDVDSPRKRRGRNRAVAFGDHVWRRNQAGGDQHGIAALDVVRQRFGRKMTERRAGLFAGGFVEHAGYRLSGQGRAAARHEILNRDQAIDGVA